MNNTPEGWDNDVPPALIEAAKSLRHMYVALMSAGFAMEEAAAIIAHMLAANDNDRSTGD